MYIADMSALGVIDKILTPRMNTAKDYNEMYQAS